jgi:enoyl-CoA hydratase
MEFKNFLLEIDREVAVFTINRPEVRNALNSECWTELGDFVEYLNKSADIKVAIITGAGEKAFAAGADLNALKALTMRDVIHNAAGQVVLKKLENCNKPVIAAVNGVAFGGGCELALACDIRIAAENAKFGLPELGVGVLPGAGGTQRLAKLIGLGRAKEVILAGRIIAADEAVEIGLAFKSVPLKTLLEEAKKIAATIMTKSPFALSLAKKALNAALSTDQETGMLLEQFAFAMAMASEDKVEGIQAFLEKRPPAFKGK